MTPVRGRHVILISYVYPPDNYVGALRPHRLTKYLTRRGFSVRVVAAGVPEECGSVGNIYRVRGELEHARRRRSIWFWMEFLMRLLALRCDEGITWVPRVIRLVRQWEREGVYADSPPVIITTSPPVTCHLAGRLLQRRFGWKWIADFRDPLLGNPCRAAQNPRVDAYLESRIFRHADVLIANTESIAKVWKNRAPEHREKIQVIWNGFDPETAQHARAIPVRSQRLLSHVGNLYGGRYPTRLFRALERVIAAGKLDPETISVRFAGPHSEPEPQEASRPWLDFQPGQIPREDAARMIAESDGLLLIDFDGAVLGDHPGYQVPAKLYDYLGIGRPILACLRRGSPTEYILERAGVPFRCLYADASDEDFDQSLMEFLSLSSEPVPASHWFHDNFGAPAQAAQWEAIIERLAERVAPRR